MFLIIVVNYEEIPLYETADNVGKSFIKWVWISSYLDVFSSHIVKAIKAVQAQMVRNPASENLRRM